MAETFDPYYKWLGIPPKDQPPHHYRLLGIELFEPDRDVIDAAANRLMGYLKELAAGDDAMHSQKLLNEISRARLCLLSRDKKIAYDQELRAKLAVEESKSAAPVAEAPPPFQPPHSPPPPVFEPPAFLTPPQVIEPPQIETEMPVVQASNRSKPPSLKTRNPPPVVRDSVHLGSGEDRTKTLATGPLRSSQRRMVLAVAGLVVLGMLAGLFVIGLMPPASDDEGDRAASGKDVPERNVSRPVLALVLTSEERNEITEFLLDDQAQPLPPEAEFTLDAGRHRLILRRAGYQEVFDSITLVNGVHREYRPRWRRETDAAALPNSSTPPGVAMKSPPNEPPLQMTPVEPPPASPATSNGSPAPANSPGVPQPSPPSAAVPVPPAVELASDAKRQAAATAGWPGGFGRMVAHWPFDSDTGDRTGLRHDGLALGEAKYVSGRVGNALQFAPDLRFEVATPVLTKASEFSCCCWMNLSSLPAGEGALLSGETLVLFIRGGHPVVEIGGHKPLPGPGTDGATGGFQGLDLSESLGTWVHLGVSYSARFRQLHYFVNGAHRGCQHYAESVPVSWGRTLVVGVSGLLDDLRVFDYRLGSVDFQALVEGSFQPPASPPRPANGKLACETWFDVSPAVSRVELDSTLRKKPDQTSTIEEALSHEAVAPDSDRLDCIQGFLYPPERGEYTLWLEASGQATLYLQRFEAGQDTLQEMVASRASQPASTARIALEINPPCYFRIVHFYDAASGGKLRLGWQRPGSDERLEAIPADHFGSYRPVP
jgi:hypothetical protein